MTRSSTHRAANGELRGTSAPTTGGPHPTPTPTPAPVPVTALSRSARPTDPHYERFASLRAEVERLRELRAHWQAQLERFEQAYARTVAPLWRALHAAQVDAALALERQIDAAGWTRGELAKLRDALAELIADLQQAGHGDPADARLAALRSRQTGMRPKGRDADAAGSPDAGASAGTDIDIDIDAEFESRRAQRAADARARQQERRSRRMVRPDAPASRSDAEPAAQSLRQVFRRVASALHPDRETDPERRRAKTALMQAANRANADADVLALLELQGRIARTDDSPRPHGTGAHSPANVQRLAQYTHLLAQQATDLRAQIDRIEARFRADVGLPIGRGLNPDRLVSYAKQDARALRDRLASVQAQARVFDDASALREWLRGARA